MTSRERVFAAIAHREPDRVPIDLGATPSSGISAIAYGNLKRHLGLTGDQTRVDDVVQQLAEPEDAILDRFHIDALPASQAPRPAPTFDLQPLKTMIRSILCASLFLTPDVFAAPDANLQWWREARFGLFIHWGPVSLKGTEIGWSRAGERRGYRGPGTLVPTDEYDNLYRQFNPTLFNAREWVALAQAAGMKYLVFTSRHHDGFSMFDTQASDYKITSPLSPFRRDVVRELADACHAAGLKFGLYYSQPDWRHPDAFTPDRHDRYLAYLKTQVRELLTNYGRLDILWFDGLGKKEEDYDGEAINRLARELQPHLLINNRNGLPEDFDTPEQRVGKYQDHRPWESC
ncbi:MAG: hypothetical protein FJ399_16900, partial [Verrucomicrobia bacterium]|nr:hypothetical protein [Verrucomicrobiota bacterium]